MDTAFVNIWGHRVGAVAWDAEVQLASFQYDPSFLTKEWDLSPIKIPPDTGDKIYSFPELRQAKDSDYDTFKGLPGLLADMLPDKYGNQLINIWLSQQGRPTDSMNPVEKLCFIGTRGMGALEFEPATPASKDKSYNIEIDSLVDISRQMLEKRERFVTDLSQDEEQAVIDILKIGTSAGGARPKAVIAYNETTGAVRSGQANAPKGYEQWLIKLDGVSDVQLGDTQGYGRVEMAYHKMAVDCGVEMMECRLLEENDRAHFMTKRYDREGSATRHHVQTWCAMEHYDFNEIRSFSYEQLFQTMRRLRLDYKEAEQMYRRMVFNVIARNCDDHTKNFSFRMKQDQEWTLAPAYDICHAYRPDSYWVSQHALSINGKREKHTKEDLKTIAKSMNIKRAEKIIIQVSEVVSQWESYAKEQSVDEKKMKAISETLLVGIR
ncbi:type II toxin-antitoxin system HipA family toxin [Saprospiraceae bacterium]|nr:type II toxin-antitoxin system HipA family toxin [Saprospiraceae bacterium]